MLAGRPFAACWRRTGPVTNILGVMTGLIIPCGIACSVKCYYCGILIGNAKRKIGDRRFSMSALLLTGHDYDLNDDHDRLYDL